MTQGTLFIDIKKSRNMISIKIIFRPQNKVPCTSAKAKPRYQEIKKRDIY